MLLICRRLLSDSFTESTARGKRQHEYLDETLEKL
jgi:hypothetical protein